MQWAKLCLRDQNTYVNTNGTDSAAHKGTFWHICLFCYANKATLKIWVFAYFQAEVPFSQLSRFTFGNQSYPSK